MRNEKKKIKFSIEADDSAKQLHSIIENDENKKANDDDTNDETLDEGMVLITCEVEMF